jgi:RNA polymerase sigma-70 factor (ECF subfamily)
MSRERTVDDAARPTPRARHGRALLAHATRLLGDRAAAEDIVQDADRAGAIRGRDERPRLTRGWLLTVTATR